MDERAEEDTRARAEEAAASEGEPTTAREQRRAPTLEDRLAREEAERIRDDRTEAAPGQLVEDELVDESGGDREPELISTLAEPEEPDSPADRLVEATPEEREEAAEEAAVHVRRRAPGGTEHPDDYVFEEPNTRG